MRLLECVQTGEWGERVLFRFIILGKKNMHRPKDKLAREQFGIVRLAQKIGGLQWQISMVMVQNKQAACWGSKWWEKRLSLSVCYHHFQWNQWSSTRDGFELKRPINAHFSRVSVLHSQLKLSEAVSPEQSCHDKSSRKKLCQVPELRRAETSKECDRSAGQDLQ